MEVEDVAEDPKINIDAVSGSSTLVTEENSMFRLRMDENNNVGDLAGMISATDEDPGDAMGLAFSLESSKVASTFAFKLGAPGTVLPNDNSRTIALMTETSLNYEIESVFVMNISVTDSTGRSATIRDLIVEVNDINEPPSCAN